MLNPKSRPLDVLAYVGLKELNLLRDGREWGLWTAKSQDPLGNSEAHTLLFFGSRTTWSTVDEAVRTLRLPGGRDTGPLAVVVQNSSSTSTSKGLARIQSQTQAKTVDTVRAFMAKALERRMGAGSTPYEDMQFTTPFVDPYVRVSNVLAPAPAIETLRGWLCSDDLDGPRVAVLVAPAALGKTTVARRLAMDLGHRRRLKRFPLLITSDQWVTLALRTDVSVTDIWQVAMQGAYRATPSPEDLETAIGNGLIIPIFDGFDELCTRLPGHFSPEAILMELEDFLTDGRILMTARDVFWHEKVGDSPVTSVQVIRLEPFDADLREQYLGLRFPGADNKRYRKEAARLLQALDQEERHVVRGKAETPLSCVPLVLELVCECARADETGRGELNLGSTRPGESALDGVVLELLEREQTRQQLAIGGRSQFEMFKLLAGEVGDRFTVEDLRLYAEVECRTAMGSKELAGLEQSALLRCVNGDRAFRFDFVHDHFQGLYLADLLDSQSLNEHQLKAALSQQAGGGTPVLDEAAKSLVRRGYDQWRQRLKEASRSLLPTLSPEAQSGFLHLVLGLVRWGEPNLERREVADRFFEMAGDGTEISGLTLQGRFDRLGLHGKAFRDCVFRGAGFGRCVFDASTRFTGCCFLDPFELVDCNGFSQVPIDDVGHIEPAAYEVFQKEKGRGSVPPTEAQVKDVLRKNLRKFREGSFGFKSLNSNAMYRGSGGNSPLAPEVWKTLSRRGLIESFGPGEKVMKLSASAKGDVHRFLEHNIATGRVRQVVEDLKRSLCSGS